jgi:phage N-6-adenine-methyltransferase
MMASAAATQSISWRTQTSPAQTERWHTPEALYLALDREFEFTIDVAADRENAKCVRFVDREQDALEVDWTGERVFCNPPYGRELERWVEKGMLAAQEGGATVVMVLPARTGNRWFHRYCLPHAEIRFIQGRLGFSGTRKGSAPFDSMVVVFRPWSVGQGTMRTQPTLLGFART